MHFAAELKIMPFELSPRANLGSGAQLHVLSAALPGGNLPECARSRLTQDEPSASVTTTSPSDSMSAIERARS